MRPFEERGLAQATGELHPSSCTYVQRHHKKYFNEFLHPFNPPAVVAEAMGGWRQHLRPMAEAAAAGPSCGSSSARIAFLAVIFRRRVAN